MFSMGQAAGQDEEGTLNRTAETGMGMLKVMSSARPALVCACKTAKCALGHDRVKGLLGREVSICGARRHAERLLWCAYAGRRGRMTLYLQPGGYMMSVPQAAVNGKGKAPNSL